jgi:hypothetical protein
VEDKANAIMTSDSAGRTPDGLITIGLVVGCKEDIQERLAIVERFQIDQYGAGPAPQIAPSLALK